MKLAGARAEYAKALYHIRKLSKIMNKMHNDGLIVYNTEKFSEESPCHSLYKVEERLEATTKEKFSQLVFSELHSEYWKKHSGG